MTTQLPITTSFTIEMLYSLIDQMNKQEIEGLMDTLTEELELRDYKHHRVEKFKKEIEEEKRLLVEKFKKLKQLKELEDVYEDDDDSPIKPRRKVGSKKK